MLSLDMDYKEGKVYMGIRDTKCIFEEATHQYFLVDVATGEVIKELISVTTLLKKHGISPDYSSVPSEVLKAKAEYGTMVHKELENYIKHGEIGFSQELQDFIGWQHENNFEAIDSEFIVYNDIVAGTVDLLGEIRFAIDDSYKILGDFKTTATLHTKAVRWQLSLYAYLYKHLFGGKTDCLKAFHFGDKFKDVDIEFIPTKEIEKLLECERNGELYQQKQLVIAKDLEAQLVAAETTIKQIELQKKEAEANAKNLRQMLLEQMRDNGVEVYESERVRIKYTPPTTREELDTKRIAEELPDIAKQYKKTTDVKDKITITLRG